MYVWIDQEMSLHSQCSFPICRFLIVKVQQLLPLCINHQHFLLAFMQSTHLSRPPVSVHLSVYITSFKPPHPSQPEWDNKNGRWRGIWREVSLL